VVDVAPVARLLPVVQEHNSGGSLPRSGRPSSLPGPQWPTP
jgi:hypothetical protein